jgi:hypothetical protein
MGDPSSSRAPRKPRDPNAPRPKSNASMLAEAQLIQAQAKAREADAQLLQAQAQMRQAEAQLDSNRTLNTLLSKILNMATPSPASITSPTTSTADTTSPVPHKSVLSKRSKSTPKKEHSEAPRAPEGKARTKVSSPSGAKTHNEGNVSPKIVTQKPEPPTPQTQTSSTPETLIPDDAVRTQKGDVVSSGDDVSEEPWNDGTDDGIDAETRARAEKFLGADSDNLDPKDSVIDALRRQLDSMDKKLNRLVKELKVLKSGMPPWSNKNKCRKNPLPA